MVLTFLVEQCVAVCTLTPRISLTVGRSYVIGACVGAGLPQCCPKRPGTEIEGSIL